MDKKDSKHNFIILMLVVTILLIGFIVGGFILYSTREKNIVEEEENGADIILNYSSVDSGLQIRKATKVSDSVGMVNLKDGEYFDFSIEVLLDSASSVEYEIAIVKDDENSTIPDSDIKIYLEKEKDGTYTKVFGPSEFVPLKKSSEYGTKKGNMSLIEVKKKNSNADNYRLRMWLSDKSNLNDGSYSVNVEVHGIAK